MYKQAVRFPFTTLMVSAAVTLACAPGVVRLRLRTDGQALVPRNDPAVLIDDRLRELFGVDDPIVVAIETDDPEGVFNYHTLGVVRALTTKLAETPGIEPGDLTSLATERRDKVYTGSLRFRPFLDPFPDSPEDLNEIREDLKALELFTGTLVSYDSRSTAILVEVSPKLNRSRLVRDFRAKIAELGDIPERVSVVGAPVAESLLGVHILEDLGVLDLLAGVRTIVERCFGWRILPRMHELDLACGGENPVRLIVRAFGRPLPVAVLAIALILWLVCRSFWGMLLPLGEVGACLLATFGLMGYFDVPFYLTMAVLPVILTAIGVADEIHIFARYRQALREPHAGQHPAPLLTTMEEMWRPVVKTSLTSCIGFMSFALSPLEPVKMFGIFTAVGILFCMFWSLTVIPAALLLLNPRHFHSRNQPEPTESDPPRQGVLRLVTGRVLRARWLVILAAAALVAVTPLGIDRLYVQDSWINGFATDSDFYQATQRVNRGYRGTHELWLCIEAEPFTIKGEIPAENLRRYGMLLTDKVDDPRMMSLVGDRIHLDLPEPQDFLIKDVARQSQGILIRTDRRDGMVVGPRFEPPDEPIAYSIDASVELLHNPLMIEAIGRLEDALEAEPTVGGVLGAYAYLTTTSFMLHARKPGTRNIPDQPEQLGKLYNYYRLVRGQQRLDQMLTPDHNRTLISVFLKNANFKDTAHLMKVIERFHAEQLAPMGLKLSFGGDVAVSQAMIPAIVRTQVVSLLISLAGIFGVVLVLFASPGAGLLCVLPPALAVLFNYAVMGACDIPLGVATSMFCGMTLGVGVDYSIHLIERCRISFGRCGDVRSALGDAVSFAGPAIIFDAVAIAVGFGVLTLSKVPANNRLGVLLVVSICSCLLVTLLLLPALLMLWRPRFLRRALAKAEKDGSSGPE
jgi:hypothetical protein